MQVAGGDFIADVFPIGIDVDEFTRLTHAPDALETYEKMRANSPDFTKIHFADADTPEECVLLHALAMNGVHLGVEVMLEPYASWYRGQDLRV